MANKFLLTLIIIIYNIIDLFQSRGEYMNYMMELATIAKAHGGIIENKIAAQHVITKAMLYKLLAPPFDP